MATSPEVTDDQEDFGDRAWLAYLALEREDEHGRLPPQTRIESEHGIARGTLGKVFSGERKELRGETLSKAARALLTTVDFLVNGSGKRPTPRQPIFPRPRRFDAEGKPVALSGVYEGLAPELLGPQDLALLTPEDVVYLRTSEGRVLNELPQEVQRAVMGAVHLLGCPLEAAVGAAQSAMRQHVGAQLTPKMWLAAIEHELAAKPPAK